MPAQPLGLIGIGLLGTSLAERFLRAGYTVVGFDTRCERRDALVSLGGQAASAVEAVARCPRIVLSLPNSDVVEAVLVELVPHLAPGTLLIDTTTGDPERTTATARDLSTKGVRYVDATVLGSSEQTRAGEVVVMAGGEADAVAACAELFGWFAAQWFHVGGPGSGARMKLVVNLVLGLNRAVLAEGLAFARSCGLAPEKALEVLRAGSASSRVMDTKGPKMLARDFTPQARLAQHLKDVRLILAEAARAEARVPLSEAHRALLERVVEMGGGADDNSAVIRAYEEEPNPPGPPSLRGKGGETDSPSPLRGGGWGEG